MRTNVLLCGVAALALGQVANAAPADLSETRLDTVNVEGSRLNQTETEIGSSVSIITADDLELLGFDFAIDALALAPGVTVNQNGSMGGTASVRIRGNASGQTLVLIDGVPVNDPSQASGGYEFAYLDPENIERIEVLKGPQSTLWGTDAIGGVVSITTKEPEQGLGGSAFAEVGSFNTVRAGGSVGNANDLGDFRLAVSGTTSNGISKADEANGNDEQDGYDNLTISGKGGLNLGENARLSTSILWTNAESEYDSYDGGAQGSVSDGDERTENESLAANIALDLTAFDGRLENRFLFGYSDLERENFTDGVSSYLAEGDRQLYRYQGTLNINEMNTLAFGAEREETSANGDDRALDSLFALYEFKPVESLTLTGGLRMDDDDDFGSETTGRVAAAWQATDNVLLRASWGQGFKAPTIYQLTYICTFCGLTEPNADLQPETSEAFDVGVEWRSNDGRAQIGVTYFDQETENQIDFDYSAGYANIAYVESQGVEVTGAFQATDWLNLTANYAYIDAEDGDGNELTRLPESTANLTAAFDPEGPWSGALHVRYNGEEANTNGTTLDSWTRLDVTGRYAVNDSVELYGRIENLTDEEYQQILGYGTPGISGSVGVRLRY